MFNVRGMVLNITGKYLYVKNSSANIKSWDVSVVLRLLTRLNMHQLNLVLNRLSREVTTDQRLAM